MRHAQNKWPEILLLGSTESGGFIALFIKLLYHLAPLEYSELKMVP